MGALVALRLRLPDQSEVSSDGGFTERLPGLELYGQVTGREVAAPWDLVRGASGS